MTAENIRALPLPGIDVKIDGQLVDDAHAAVLVAQTALLREIAAQLAELNAAIRGTTEGALAVALYATGDSIPVRHMER